VFLAAAVPVCARVLRPQNLRWGATQEEASAWLPGDELLEEADGRNARDPFARPHRLSRRGWPTWAPPRANVMRVGRNRFRLPRLIDRIGMVAMEPGSLLMERKMLRGIKKRAETLASEGA
jgi:hypothetical protein